MMLTIVTKFNAFSLQKHDKYAEVTLKNYFVNLEHREQKFGNKINVSYLPNL